MRKGRSGLGGAGLVAVGVLSLLAGCAAPGRFAPEAALDATLESASGRFRIEYAPRDARDAALIRQGVDAALPKLARWGELQDTVTLKVMPNHRALEDAVHQRGLDWLRAWSRYDEVFVQAPSSWGLAGATPPQINELLLHELTHSLMYQLASDRLGWSRKQIPLWFREGMASFTADQGYRWVTLEEIAKYLERHPEGDPVQKPDDLYREDSNLVYGAAHYAFSFLVKRYGEDAVRGILREMKGGKEFPEAFESAVGLNPDAFTRDFIRYVRWRGFRNGRVLPSAGSPRN